MFNGLRSASQLLRTVKDASSAEIMVFLLARDFDLASAERWATAFHLNCRPGWLRYLASNSWISQT
jgi:hypothetical protein